MSFQELFASYNSLLREVDGIFTWMQKTYPDAVLCIEGCADCCHASFDVTFIEASSLRMAIQQIAVDDPVRQYIRLQAGKAKEEIEQKVPTLVDQGDDQQQLLDSIATWRIRCPLLTADNRCAVYDARPLTCRVYGLPTEISGKGHVCGFTGFDPGKTYPTIKLDTIVSRLDSLSERLAAEKPGEDPAWGKRRFFVHEIIDSLE